MNNILTITVGVLLTVVASLLGLVLIPGWQFEQLPTKELTAADGTVTEYPVPLDPQTAGRGREVYRGLGCLYCHSQQVRPEGFGADLDRGRASDEELKAHEERLDDIDRQCDRSAVWRRPEAGLA